MRILLADNADSFTWNLEHLLALAFHARVEVAPYPPASACGFDLLAISPGPGHPGEYPAYGPLLDSGVPVLGICLGMQIINEHFGGTTDRLPGCVHGRAEAIALGDRTLAVARYHSLHTAALGQGLEVLAVNAAGVVMALAHATRPLAGFQFHPESFLTEDGEHCLAFAARRLGLA